MKAESRANVASSFTVIKGAMIDETYAVLAAWDFSRSKRENLDRLREENFIGASSVTWLRDVAKVLNRRFDPAGRDRPLVTLAKHGLPVEEWKPLLLWHMTRDEFLVRDFLETCLFAAFEAGAFRVQPEEVEKYLGEIAQRGGMTEHAWSEQTSKRVAAGLLKISVDFGLLRGSVAKEFVSFHLPEKSFLYLLHAMSDRRLPEQGGRDLISTDPLSPGTVYAAGVTSDGTVGLYRVEVSLSTGIGKLKLAGGVAGAMKESVQRAFSYLQAKKSDLGIARDFDTSDFHVEVIDLLANRVEAELGVAFFVACYSAIRKAPVSPALLVLGNMSVQGNIKPLRSLTEPLQVAKDNGAKRALIPIENKRNFLDVSADIMEHVDPIFFGDPKTAALKVLGIV